MSTTTTKWSIDTAHSTINFKAKHLMITTVTGTFKSFTADIETIGNNFSTANVKFAADVASVFSGNEQRDEHLKSDDFFNAEKYPHITFHNTDVTRKSDRAFILHGKMTIRDVTMDIDLEVDFNGVVKDPWGVTKAGVSFRTKINRKDFGLKFHVLNEAGDLLVSDEIRIEADIQMSAIEA